MVENKFDIEDYRSNLSSALEKFAEMMEAVSNYVQDFKDNIIPALSALKEGIKALKAYLVLGDHQFTCWAFLNDKDINDILSSDNLDEYLEKKIEDDSFICVNSVLEQCRESSLISETNKKILSQFQEALSVQLYDLALVGIVSVFDGALSKASKDDSPKFVKRLDAIKKRIEEATNGIKDINEEETIEFGLYCSWTKTVDSFSCFSDFSKPESEPIGINRHWIVHGRKTTCASKLDCYKMMNALYGLILLTEYSDD